MPRYDVVVYRTEAFLFTVEAEDEDQAYTVGVNTPLGSDNFSHEVDRYIGQVTLVDDGEETDNAPST